MTKWVNENVIEGEMSNADFQQAVINRMQDRVKKGNENNDGFVTVYRERRIHWGIPYELAVLRYFAVTRLPDNQFELRDYPHLNAIGMHVVVEGKHLSEALRKALDLDEFLWHDTLHSYQLDWTLKQQWDYAENLAIRDCKRLATNLIIRLKMGRFLEAVVIYGKNVKSYSKKLGNVVLSKWRFALEKIKGGGPGAQGSER